MYFTRSKFCRIGAREKRGLEEDDGARENNTISFPELLLNLHSPKIVLLIVSPFFIPVVSVEEEAEEEGVAEGVAMLGGMESFLAVSQAARLMRLRRERNLEAEAPRWPRRSSSSGWWWPEDEEGGL